ncbi:SUMF1/EgtB/PvdO family nonheme iron enzyme [Archangium violaceum]|uniref:formylglycine-generating enzyme family protein n=1 Tax=Archangium violaceum TaxID=83451 RepID=UPI001951CCCE|nr:SUMF1/EgtB/PvdO family nonheme iron enzyme [Archangium violaceum]QRO01346.1 SUMF1/EgtB/PvdO family nonheme iron enzyme [Archangium violaceum]
MSGFSPLEDYVPPTAEDLSAELRSLRGLDVERLAVLAEEPSERLERRLASGLLLGLSGDPRIRVFDPPMVDIPAGVATIGVEPSRLDALQEEYDWLGVQREWLEKESPRFQVELRSFRLGRYPVTNLEFIAFLKENPLGELPSSWSFGRVGFAAANQPVHTLSPRAAEAYAAWLSSRTGRRFRLPTEFEWEYAASGPEARSFPWGERFSEDLANTREAGLLSATPVGIFPGGRSPFGALDMAGNVEEYVADEYRPYPGGRLIEDEILQKLGRYRITRGGAFDKFQDLARCHRRHGPVPDSSSVIGFRLAEDP